MDYPTLKRHTLMSDYLVARDIYTEAMQDGQDNDSCMAYIYRAGLVAGKKVVRHSRDKLGNKLAEAHKEIKALREQIEMLSGIIRDNINREATEDE